MPRRSLIRTFRKIQPFFTSRTSLVFKRTPGPNLSAGSAANHDVQTVMDAAYPAGGAQPEMLIFYVSARVTCRPVGWAPTNVAQWGVDVRGCRPEKTRQLSP